MKKLDAMLKQIEFVSDEQMATLSGGFAFGALSQEALEAEENVNVDVSGHTCACQCGDIEKIIHVDVR